MNLEQVSYERVGWIMGPAPREMQSRWPQDVQDPPTSGWHGVLVYRPKREDAKYAQVFDPATGWGRDVLLDSLELNTSKPINEWDAGKMLARIRKTCAERDRLGCGMSYGKANFFLEKLGSEPYARIVSEVEGEVEKAPKAVAPPKVDPRAGLIQAGDIAAKLKIEPRILRDVCRKLGIEKPAIGWAGDQKWADNIEKVVTAFLASPKEAKPHIAKGFKEVSKEKKKAKK